MSSSTWKKQKQPEEVAGAVLKRAQLTKIASKLQNRLALAQFKTDRGWEDLTLDTIEPMVEEELRQRRPTSSGDMISDSSSSSASDFQYSNSRTLLSSPLKATAISSDQNGSNGNGGRRKRTYDRSFEPSSSASGSRKRFCSSPTASRSIQASHDSWKDQHQLAQSSPIKARKPSHFTTSAGPDLSFYRTSANLPQGQRTFQLAAISDDEDEVTLPTHSFTTRSFAPRTPSPIRDRASGRRKQASSGRSGEEGADLLLYLATSPSPAMPSARHRIMQPPSTPPRNPALPSSMMTTPGTSSGFPGMFGNPTTPSQAFEFSDFVNITPSPAQGAFTPRAVKTPSTVARRMSFLPTASPVMREHSARTGSHLGGNLFS